MVPGIIVAKPIIPVVTQEAFDILGRIETLFKYLVDYNFVLLLRCFVGDETDQWRKCSDRYFPTNLTQPTHPEISLKNNLKSYTSKLKHGSAHSGSDGSDEYQKAPRGGIHSLNDFAAARLWPVTYLYNDGPPNSTELSNFVDCNKENC